tara:strand:- start:275 stop:619 length:345 start_codon:yes stop_codon:yes gene_type:complete
MRHSLWLPFYSGLIGITYLSLAPLEEFPIPNIISIDKLGHLVGYFVLCALLYLPLKNRKKPYLRGSLFVLIYSALLELVQHFFIVNRYGDIADLVANAVGVLLAIGIFSKRIKS